jgi:DNA repair protein RecO (recombination protein O)
MATLKEWEVLLSRRPLVGRNALTGLYINELLYRALPRGEAEPGLFDQYGELLDLLHRESGVAEAAVDPGGPDSIELAIENALRRLELGLLAGLGYGLQLAQTHDGHAVLSSAQYAVDLESGVRLLADAPWSGELLLSLAAMQQIDHRPAGPPLELRRQQRRLLRSLLQQMLGERPLASWGMVRGFGAGPRPG